MVLRRIGAVTLIAALGFLAAPAVQAAAPAKQTTITVYHEAVVPTAVLGSGLGTVRTFFIPIAVNGKAANDQYLVGTLTTVAQGFAGSQEIRASNLSFVFGDEADQLAVGGISYYPTDSATLSAGTRTVRPVVGGSGRFDGARGQVISTNLGANGWTHVFKIRMP